MVKRALAALAAAVVVGTVGAPVATAAGDPGVRPPGQCVWIWTGGPPQCKKLE